MFNISAPELIIILIIALVIFGPSKLPEMGASLGRALREFRRASKEIQSQMSFSEGEAEEEKKT